MTRNKLTGITSVLFLMCVLVSTIHSFLVWRTLWFHYRDFPYYLEFATKLASPTLSNQLSLNPVGNNMFGMSGVEARDYFHQAVHFEPVKYLYALIMASFHHPLALFIFVSVLYFLPILFLVRKYPIEKRRDTVLVGLFAAAYSLYPAALLAPSFDLRPYVFLTPLYLLSFLAIHTYANHAVTLLLFNSLFLAREEALILSLPLIAYAWLRFNNQRPARSLMISWVVWFCAILSWLSLSLYQSSSPIFTRVVIIGLATCAALLTLLVWHPRLQLSSWRKLPWLKPVVLLLPVSAVLIQFLREKPAGLSTVASLLLTNARWTLLVVSTMVVLLAAWPLLTRRLQRATLLLLGAWLIVATISATVPAHSVRARLATYYRTRHEADPIWTFRNQVNPYTTHIFTDYFTYQAFTDFEHAYSVTRLPAYLTADVERDYQRESR